MANKETHDNSDHQTHIHWSTRIRGGRKLFTVMPIIPHLLIIGICLAAYYYLINYYYYFNWSIYAYYGLKLIIAYEILAAAVRSLWVPLIALIIGCIVLFSNIPIFFAFMEPSTAWQLSGVALVGILITVFVKF